MTTATDQTRAREIAAGHAIVHRCNECGDYVAEYCPAHPRASVDSCVEPTDQTTRAREIAVRLTPALVCAVKCIRAGMADGHARQWRRLEALDLTHPHHTRPGRPILLRLTDLGHAVARVLAEVSP
jgi:hypothetical protein